jgi:hypothetical protein
MNQLYPLKQPEKKKYELREETRVSNPIFRIVNPQIGTTVEVRAANGPANGLVAAMSNRGSSCR